MLYISLSRPQILLRTHFILDLKSLFFFFFHVLKKWHCFITIGRWGLHEVVGMLGSGDVWAMEMMTERLEGRGCVWRPGPGGPQIRFWEGTALRKESWQAIARPPIRFRNSEKSSCPSLLVSSLFIMRSRTPGSFWFFVKAASSVFMKLRNSVLERV